MSKSTRRAIAGGEAASSRTHEHCLEAIKRFDAAQSEADFRAVLTWSKEHDWFFRSAEDDLAMKAAHRAARERILALKR